MTGYAETAPYSDGHNPGTTLRWPLLDEFLLEFVSRHSRRLLLHWLSSYNTRPALHRMFLRHA